MFHRNENTGEVNTQNATCSSGSIEWHYPAGRIRLHFPDVPGQLCITRGIAAYDDVISRVYLENGDQPQDLQFDSGASSNRRYAGTYLRGIILANLVQFLKILFYRRNSMRRPPGRRSDSGVCGTSKHAHLHGFLWIRSQIPRPERLRQTPCILQ